MPRPLGEMIGCMFGRLTVLALGKNCRKQTTALAVCKCGRSTVVMPFHLKNGDTKSCGCLSAEVATSRALRHGQSKTPIHNIWSTMLSRCSNPRNEHYADYGGRGIAVCARWLTFENFASDMGPRPPGHSIDRIDNDGNYDPENCRWATQAQQNRNRRNTLKVTLGGVTKPFIDWCLERSIDYKLAHARLRKGWSAARIFDWDRENNAGEEA